MHIPVIKKLMFKDNLLIERALPSEGKISASKGDHVEPFNKLGTCKVSYEITELGSKFSPHGSAKKMSAYHAGALVGHVGRSRFNAPYNGYLEKNSAGYYFRSEAKDYWLLPGVWGEITDILDNRSVLIKTQAVDLHVPVTTSANLSGELIVFPNPSEILAAQYFNNYLKSSAGKIVYVGHTVSMDIIKTAERMNVGTVLGGSADKEVFDYAVANNIGLGLFSGFGEINTPDFVFDFINNVSNRYVFFYANRNVLQIPIPPDDEMSMKSGPKSVLRYVKKGLKVQLLNSNNFGQIGVVDRVSKFSIFVKLDDKDDVVEVTPPNLLAIE